MRILSLAFVATIVLTTTGGLALAQHDHGHGHARAPVHHGTYFGHRDWNYVVPHHSTYAGAYYSTGDAHYYTPAQIVPVGPPVQGIAVQPPPVTALKPVELTFDGFSRYQDLAGRLDAAVNLLCLDMHYNYRHNPRFAQIYGEAYGVLQAAKFIHGKEHQGDQDTIRRRMTEVDRLFHHVQGEVAGWTREPVKPIGPETLQAKAAGVEAILHHLCFDVGVKPHEQPAEVAPPPPVEEAPPPPRG